MMFLIYTDESGTSFKKDEYGNFRDGPCLLYGGLAVEVGKLYMLESAFKALCNEILGIENIYEVEIKTGDIFYGKNRFEGLEFDKKEEFFREVLQLLAKFNVPMIAGLVYKDSNIFNSQLEKVASAIYAFFSALDTFLLEKGKYGIVIADEFGDNKDIKEIRELLDSKNLVGKKGGVKLPHLLRRIFFEKLNRFREYSFEPIIPLRYRFESQIYSVVDNIHYVNSKFSVFNQLADIVLFLFNTALEVSERKEVFEDKKQMVKALTEDFTYFLCNTRSIISWVIRAETLYDVMLEFYEMSVGIKPFSKLVGEIKKTQADGT